MRAYGSVIGPEGDFDVTLEVAGVDPSIKSVQDVRRRYEAAPEMHAAILAFLEAVDSGAISLAFSGLSCEELHGLRESVRA